MFNEQTDYLIDKFIVHEKYSSESSPRNDIALIKLRGNVTFSHHDNLPACLYQAEFNGSDFVAVSIFFS